MLLSACLRFNPRCADWLNVEQIQRLTSSKTSSFKRCYAGSPNSRSIHRNSKLAPVNLNPVRPGHCSILSMAGWVSAGRSRSRNESDSQLIALSLYNGRVRRFLNSAKSVYISADRFHAECVGRATLVHIRYLYYPWPFRPPSYITFLSNRFGPGVIGSPILFLEVQ
jgi:hypothetical protein